MDCNLIITNLGACTDKIYKGYEKIGKWTDYENIDRDSILEADGKVTFSLKSGQFYDILDESAKPFDGSKPTSEISSKHGYKLFNDEVLFPLKPHTPENSALVSTLAHNHKIVVILTQKAKGANNESKYPVFGLSGGLYLDEPLSDATSDAAWDLKFRDMNTSTAGRFIGGANAAAVETNYSNLIDSFYTITSTIETGDQIYFLIIESSRVGSINLPDGTTLNTVNGEVTTTYNGVSGAITFNIPKDATGVSLEGSGINSTAITDYIGDISFASCFGIENINANSVAGQLNCNDCLNLGTVEAALSSYIYCADSTVLTTLIAPKANTVYAPYCALSAQSIGDILYAAYDEGRENVNYNFQDGLNANQDDVKDAILAGHGISGFIVIDGLTALGGTVLLNT